MQRQSRKRSKHKKKHKSDTVSGDENGTPDIEAVWNQMAAVFEVCNSVLCLSLWLSKNILFEFVTH